MSLPWKVKSLDEIPEAQRGLYTEVEGGFQIDVSGVPEAPKDYEELKKAAEAAKKYHGISDDVLARAQKLDGEEVFTKADAMKLIQSQVQDGLKDSQTKIATLEQQLEAVNGERNTLKQQIDTRDLETWFREGFDGLKVKPKSTTALKHAFRDLAPSWQRDKEGNFVAVDGKGQPLLSKDEPGKPLSLKECLQGYVRENVYAFEGHKGAGIQLKEGLPLEGINVNDPVELGQNIDKFASGEFAQTAVS